MTTIDEIKKLLKSESLIIGTKQTIKELKASGLKKVFLANNCPEQVKEDIKHYSELSKTEVVYLDIPNDELGDVCKKPFFISVLGVK
jgi:large subunit ribosomal protein L30e